MPPTCYFVDIGLQRRGHSGSSAVLLLPPPPGRELPHAIVIDCGDEGNRTTLDLLRAREVQFLDHILVTHNDGDHCGGLLALLTAFRGRVGRVWFLEDRPPEDIRFLDRLEQLGDEGAFGSCERLETDRNATPRTIYPDLMPTPEAPGPVLRLEVFYPTFRDNLDTRRAKDRNAASAVLRLSYGKGVNARTILFPGDGQIRTLKRAREHFVRHFGLGPAAALSCEILAVSHHGGKLARRRPTAEQLRKLYAEVVRYRYAVVSVATGNQDGHPFPEHIEALVQPLPGAADRRAVLCTQITGQCCDLARRGSKGLLPPVPDVPQASAGSGGAKGLACAGTVVVDLGDGPLEPRRLAEHQEAVNRLPRNAERPLCRKGVPL